MKKLFKLLFNRIVLVGLALLLQIVLLVIMLVRFEEYFVYFYATSIVLALLLVLKIINSNINPGYKIAWMIPILLVPVFGVLFYLILGGKRLSKHTKKKMRNMELKMRRELPSDSELLEEIREQDEDAAAQVQYIQNFAYSPVYKETVTEYLPIGEVKFERMQEELKKAKHYIFLEYFIIHEGIMWNTILDILVEKVKEGVEVRLIYDDMGCLTTLPYGYDKKLASLGIQCCVFNPFVPVLTSRLNNRDHRKICVIDGHTGFTGGINLADEYINAYEKYGHWKDTAVMVKGEAARSFTRMFLHMWYLDEKAPDFDTFLNVPAKQQSANGFVMPYGDCPLDKDKVGEQVYMDMLNRAQKYVHIMTPYLILDGELENALKYAAERGVDVRIILPGVPDKYIPFALALTHYRSLLESGVKIYEYTPGFVHAKVFVCDDREAVVGTINLDYRSLYHHFECATYLWGTDCIPQIQDDFEKTQGKCREVTLDLLPAEPLKRRLLGFIAKAAAPLL